MVEQVEQFKSIRQLADELNTSHTQIRRLMQSLNISGESQGNGKPTLLSLAEQEQIAQQIKPSALDKLSSPLSDSHSAMIPYQPGVGEVERFAPPDRKLFKYTSTEEFTATARQNTETALDITQENSKSLTNALIGQMRQEGQKLGLTLFQAKYGTAHSVLSELEQSLAKKSGLVEETQSPTAG